jgi:D-alanyl-lipoteichoic acid acyltransferase DltB (MBOAT superfamily)
VSALRKTQWVFLLIGSWTFYWFSGFLPYLVATCASTYLFSRLIGVKKNRLLTGVWLVLHMGLLLTVKVPFTGLLMPLGISFYTFQSAGYILDVYRGKVRAERNPFRLALFVSFFPQLIQGPISRYNDLAQTLYDPFRFSAGNLSQGVQRIIWGLFKKLVIADRMIAAVALMSAETDLYTGGYAALNILLYTVVLYADFSGGIDIAIGIAKLFGVRVTENFNKPFYAVSVAEFWRRWHITMGSWFRDYLFYPLSVSKPMRRFSKFSRSALGGGFGKRLPVHIATAVTWFATGLWHGASPNFIAWGLANGAVIILSQELEPLYKRLGKAPRRLAAVRTFLLMSAIRSFDIYGGVGVTFTMVFSVFKPWDLQPLPIGVDVHDCAAAAVGVCIWIMAGLPRPRRWYNALNGAGKLLLCLLLLCGILVFGVYGYGYDAAQFIYNRF